MVQNLETKENCVENKQKYNCPCDNHCEYLVYFSPVIDKD